MVRMSDLVRGGGPPVAPRPTPGGSPTGAERPTSSAPPARPAPPPAEVTAPPESAPPARVSPEEALAQTAAAESQFNGLVRFLAGLREQTRGEAAIPWPDLERLVRDALDSLERSGELFWVANRPAVPPGVDVVAFHMARVAVQAMRVGASVGLGPQALLELGMAGSLIDVGLWQLPAALHKPVNALGADEHSLYRSHPRLGAEVIRRCSPPFPALVDMVLHHHEREQGQGFPQGLGGEAIHPHAKILGLVDTYTQLTVSSAVKPGLRPHEAIREIVRTKHESFPPSLVKALLNEISVFPPGTLVRLNSGDEGRVVGVNRNHPLRPRVEVYDSRGQRLAVPKIIDLSEAPFLYITGPVAETSR